MSGKRTILYQHRLLGHVRLPEEVDVVYISLPVIAESAFVAHSPKSISQYVHDPATASNNIASEQARSQRGAIILL